MNYNLKIIESIFKPLIPYIEKVVPYLSQTISKIGLAQFAQIAFLYNLYDSALANIFVLETNRHGTSLYSYAKIFFQGGKTTYGGKVEEDAYTERSKNRIFVYRDYSSIDEEDRKNSNSFLAYFDRACLGPYGYSSLANAAMISKSDLALIPGFILGLMTPTVKYRFTDRELKAKFAVDDMMKNSALYTEHNIGLTHLGILGSMVQGINLDVFRRISKNIPKFMFGCVQLTSAVALTCIYIGLVPTSPLANLGLTLVTEFMQHHVMITNIALGLLYMSTW